jgi:hypothetical protein
VDGPTTRRPRETELARLIADASAARDGVHGTVTRIRAEIHDPYGVRTAITSHPFVTAGVATGAGVAVAKLVFGRTSKLPHAPTRLEVWAGKLLDAGIQVVKPLGVVYLKRWLAEFEPPPSGEQTRQSAAA